MNDTNLAACLQVKDLLDEGVASDEIKLLVPNLRAAVPNSSRDNKPGERGASQSQAVNGRFRDIKARIDKLTVGREYLKLAARAHGSERKAT